MQHETQAFFLFIIFATALHAQQEFRGRVVDAEAGEPLPYASIYMAEGKGTLTNGDGEFTIEMSATENIKISYLGYKNCLYHKPRAFNEHQNVGIAPSTARSGGLRCQCK